MFRGHRGHIFFHTLENRLFRVGEMGADEHVACPGFDIHVCFLLYCSEIQFLKVIRNNLTPYRKPSRTFWCQVMYVIVAFCHS